MAGNVITENRFTDARRVNDALAQYFGGIEVDDHNACFMAVGQLMGMTCPYEPESASGSTVVIPKKYRRHFLMTDGVFQDMCDGQADGRIFEGYWSDVAGRIRAYTD